MNKIHNRTLMNKGSEFSFIERVEDGHSAAKHRFWIACKAERIVTDMKGVPSTIVGEIRSDRMDVHASFTEYFNKIKQFEINGFVVTSSKIDGDYVNDPISVPVDSWAEYLAERAAK